MSMFFKDGSTALQFMEEYQKIIKIQSPWIWEMPIIKYLFSFFFICSVLFVILETINKKIFPFQLAKMIVIRFACASLVWPFMLALDLMITGIVGSITEQSLNRSVRGSMAKYAAIELVYTSDLKKEVKDSVVKKLNEIPNAKIDHQVAKKVLREETKKAQNSFIERVNSGFVNVGSDIANESYFDAGTSNPYNGKVEGVGLAAITLNPIQIIKDIASAFLGWFGHIIRWVIFLATQTASMMMIHLMIIVYIFSILPMFSNIDIDMIKTFLALKFIPAIIAIMDYVFDAMNIMNLSINAIGNGFVDAGSASIGYSIVKIIFSVASVQLSFLIFRAKANPFFTAGGDVAGKVGGAMNAVKNFGISKIK